MTVLTHPSELKWVEGPLPAAGSVHYESWALVWLVTKEGGVLKDIVVVHPWRHSEGHIHWSGPGGALLQNYEERWRIKYWAWLEKPGEVQRWETLSKSKLLLLGDEI